MPQHEEKSCPRCGKMFECKMGTITECQCFAVALTKAEQAYLWEAGWKDCLCADCLRVHKEKVNLKESGT